MTHNDDRLENNLAEFQPRPVRRLKIPPQPAISWFRRLAAAALLVLCLGAGYREFHKYRLQGHVVQLKSPTLLLTRIGLSNTTQLDQILYSQSPNSLPNLQGPQSTLRVLAKE